MSRAAHRTRKRRVIRPGLTGIFPSRQRFVDTPLNPSVMTRYGRRTGTAYNNDISLLSISNQLPKKYLACAMLCQCAEDDHRAEIESQKVRLT
jgi:hypothetical protein